MSLKSAATKVVGFLKHEPVAVWGVVTGVVANLLVVKGVDSKIVEAVVSALVAAGIPVVRQSVSPVSVIKALLASKPRYVGPATSESATPAPAAPEAPSASK